MALNFVKSLKVKDEETGRWEGVINELSTDESYVYLQHRKLRSPNISSHVMVDLMGENPYTTPGRTLLQAFGLLEYTAIDMYYTVRGGIIEVLTEDYLRKLWPDYDLKIESYELSDFAGYNQFPHKAPFSGVLDKAITAPFRLPIEIKSKEMKDHKWISVKGNYPESEILQGQQLADLWDAPQIMMVWGFIDVKLQKYLKEAVELGLFESFQSMRYGKLAIDYNIAVKELGLTVDDVVWDHKIYDVDKVKLGRYRQFSQEIYNQVINERRIPRKWFSHEELGEIEEFIQKLK